MNALVLANFPLAIVVVLAIVGIPLWMTFKRPESAPDHAAARAYLRARASRARTSALASGTARPALKFVPQPVAAHPAVTHAAVDRAAQPTRVAA